MATPVNKTGLNATVNHERKELRDRKKSYQLIDDCTLGQDAIKKRTTVYLPQPNADDESDEKSPLLLIIEDCKQIKS